MNIPADFGTYTPNGPRYVGYERSSLYVITRDGTRLAVDVALPKGLGREARIPALVMQSRYWRATEMRQPFGLLSRLGGNSMAGRKNAAEFFTSYGYAVVNTDVRGTGASFGTWRHAWEAITVQDAYDLLEWITRQPWSDGQVVGNGVSYLGTTAELLLATGHPALRAVVPQFNHPDSFSDVAFPGGLFNERFIRAWSEMDEWLDQNRYPASYGLLAQLAIRGVKPVDGPQGRALLRQAVAEHAGNARLSGVSGDVTFRDQPVPPLGFRSDDQAVARFMDTIMAARVPVFGIASWYDAGTAAAALRRFNTYPGAQRAMIGAWNHGGLNQSSPYLPAKAAFSPPGEGVRMEVLRFLDTCLKPATAGPQRRVDYYTLGREAWQSAPAWPPPGVRSQTWFTAPGRGLAPRAPQENGADAYRVDFAHTTGVYNRWWELGVVKGERVDATGRETQRGRVLAYESAVLDGDLEIAGTPVVTFAVTSSVPDCAFFVYLEDVFPDGRIVLLSEGQLRALHRRVSSSPAPFAMDVPYHTFRQADALPLVPGERAEIALGLLPVSAVLAAGHRLRLAFAGHDAGTFPRVPAQGEVDWRIEWGARLDLPIV